MRLDEGRKDTEESLCHFLGQISLLAGAVSPISTRVSEIKRVFHILGGKNVYSPLYILLWLLKFLDQGHCVAFVYTIEQ